jgi:hypothetical protein
VQVGVEVALQEDPWPDVERRVGVERKPVVVDLHRHHRGLGRAGDVLDGDHLADVDPGDPHRRGDVQLGLRREHGLEYERGAGEGQSSAEHQVADRADHERPDHAREEVRDP